MTERNKLMQNIEEYLTSVAVNGADPISSSVKLANEYSSNPKFANMDVDKLTRILIKNESLKSFGTGFILGLGGLVTLPVTLPSGLLAQWVIQSRLVGAIAVLHGHSLHEEYVKTVILFSLLNLKLSNIFKEAGVNVAKKITLKAISKIPTEIIKQINKKLGIRLITKAGEKSVVSITKVVPVVGGFVSGGFDAASCYSVGRVAHKFFKAG